MEVSEEFLSAAVQDVYGLMRESQETNRQGTEVHEWERQCQRARLTSTLQQKEEELRSLRNESRGVLELVGGALRASEGQMVESLKREASFLSDILQLKLQQSALTTGRLHTPATSKLETTKEELAKQKSLKKIFIKKDKETRRELERVQTYADPETLDTLKIANQVRDTNRHKKKKALHKDYEELQVAHLISQEKFTVELQAEKDKNAALQKELDDLRASYKEVTLKCEAEVLSRQQVENLQCELENERRLTLTECQRTCSWRTT
ncbi:hypothetical protein INR49_012165 [Caranx melampygus]|nr:hypothetical protein INR49_012165 [Caranx melampygus]